MWVDRATTVWDTLRADMENDYAQPKMGAVKSDFLAFMADNAIEAEDDEIINIEFNPARMPQDKWWYRLKVDLSPSHNIVKQTQVLGSIVIVFKFQDKQGGSIYVNKKTDLPYLQLGLGTEADEFEHDHFDFSLEKDTRAHLYVGGTFEIDGSRASVPDDCQGAKAIKIHLLTELIFGTGGLWLTLYFQAHAFYSGRFNAVTFFSFKDDVFRTTWECIPGELEADWDIFSEHYCPADVEEGSELSAAEWDLLE